MGHFSTVVWTADAGQDVEQLYLKGRSFFLSKSATTQMSNASTVQYV